MKYRVLFGFFFFWISALYLQAVSPLSGLTSSLKKVYVTSLSQKVLNKNHILFEGEVEVQVDERLRLWADSVFIDHTKQTLVAKSLPGRLMSIEDNTFFLLAHDFTFDLVSKTGIAHDVVFNVDEGYFFAQSAEKRKDGDWKLVDVRYSACEKPVPHWQICASQIKVHKNCLIKAKNIGIKVGKVPVFGLPYIIFPVQGRSASGFLMPRFSFDYEYGLGVKQAYYQHLGPHCDTTLDVDWKAKKGCVFSDEFRWARSPKSFSQITGYYAFLNDRYLQKHKKIVKASEKLYWVAGKDFHYVPEVMPGVDACSLMRLDFGTNKEIGYHFFNSTDDVDDTFYNSLLLRGLAPSWSTHVLFDYTKVVRKDVDRVVDEKTSTVTESLHHYEYTQFPHVQVDSVSKKVWRHFYLSHTMFFDQWWYRQRDGQRVFVDSQLIEDTYFSPLQKADLVRLCYQGSLLHHTRMAGCSCTLSARPTWQAASSVMPIGNRSFEKPIESSLILSDTPHPSIHFASQNTQDERGVVSKGEVIQQFRKNSNVLERPFTSQGAWRLFCEYGAEWAFPEGVVQSQDYSSSYAMQPVLAWNFLPKFYQDHWYHFDKWDRAYPKNELSFQVRNSYNRGPLYIDLDLKQGYDFYKQDDIFSLRRGLSISHILPFSWQLACGGDVLEVQTRQDYDWRALSLVESEVGLKFFLKRVHMGCSYLFQRPEASLRRGLLLTLPHFVNMSIMLPLGKEVALSYEAQLYAQQSNHFFALRKIKPLIHRVRLDYDGHCWGFYLGYEEKKFQEFGMGRNEHSIVLAIRLNSLGSFAKRFKRLPQFLKTSQSD